MTHTVPATPPSPTKRRPFWVQHPRTFRSGGWMIRHIRAAAVVESPVEETSRVSDNAEHWIVTVYDNDYNTVEQVMMILMLATGCSAEEAYMETWEIDNLGQSVVHRGSESECREAAEIIAKIGINVEATPEWEASEWAI